MISVTNSLRLNMNSVYLQEPDDPEPEQLQLPKGTRSCVYQILRKMFQM